MISKTAEIKINFKNINLHNIVIYSIRKKLFVKLLIFLMHYNKEITDKK